MSPLNRIESIPIAHSENRMTTPVWMLLAFAMWTLLLLLLTVGTYRWSRIVSGRVAIRNFPADAAGGDDWYKRATRAHANCIENLPVFGAVVLGLYASHTTGPLVDALAVAVIPARIVQSTVHVCFVHTNTIASIRFGFYFVQFICFVWLTGLIVAARA
jgi:uncharacterized MAPEG superfamily protein